MDELTNYCNGLSISDREGPTLDLEEEMAMPGFIIAGKFFTRGALNMEAIASNFKPLWRSKNGFKVKIKVKNIGNHIVLFTFDNKLEVDAILSNEPWSSDKHLMVLQCYNKDTPVDDLTFNRTSFNLGIGTRHTSDIHKSKGSGRDLQHHWYCHQEA